MGADRDGPGWQCGGASEDARGDDHHIGKFRVDATINGENQIQRIKTTVNDPTLGDFNIEQESTDQMTFGNVKWPITWHSHHGWDDNWQFYRLSTGHNGYGGKFPNVQPNVCADPVPVPESVRQATFPADGHRRKDGQRRVSTRRRARQQLHGGVPRFRRRLRGAHQRETQPGGHRAGREAGSQQADSLAHRLSPALRSHRRHPHVQPHRRDHRVSTGRTSSS